MDITSLLFPLLILVLFIPIFLSGRRQKRQVQEMQSLQSSLEPGDVVMTTSGLRGTVVDASYEETIDLEIADGIVTTWIRAAIREKVAPPAEDGADATTGVDGTDEPLVVDAEPGTPRSTSTRRPGARRCRRTTPRTAARAADPAGRHPHHPPGPHLDHLDHLGWYGSAAPRQGKKLSSGNHPGRIRPWRYLTAFVGIVAALYALVFFTGDGSVIPKLGIDLQGGTRVTLQARTESGAEAPREQLLQAQSIIQERVDGLGVSGAEVVLDGSNLTITVPGQEGEQARSLGQTAQLRFREVLEGPFSATAPAPAPGATDPAARRGHRPGGAPGHRPRGALGPAPAPSVEPSVPPRRPAAAGRRRPDRAGRRGAGRAGLPLDAPRGCRPGGPADPGTDPAGAHPRADARRGAPPPASTPAGPADPKLAAAIAAARETRQSTDPAVQSLALTQLDCQAQDPLRGYDDPMRPLVACNQDGTEKYVLGPVFLEAPRSTPPRPSRTPRAWAG
jgi:preprotein translocase YajC subunit